MSSWAAEHVSGKMRTRAALHVFFWSRSTAGAKKNATYRSSTGSSYKRPARLSTSMATWTPTNAATTPTSNSHSKRWSCRRLAVHQAWKKPDPLGQP